jgi:ATP-dependent exoDNAse (exonuclease V) beta subunit
MKTLPKDQPERDRFVTELDWNFSVIAAAGTGKTTAITERIAQIARQRPEWLPRLVVVTFTNRASDEMQQRARQRIFEQNPSPNLLATFNRAFFGTIHSFCVKLLAAHGHHLGLPSRLDLIDDDAELWNDFVQRTDSIGDVLSSKNREALLRHVQLRDLMELGRSGKLPLAIEQRDFDCPSVINIDHVINYHGAGVRIEADQEALRKWKKEFDSDSDFLPIIRRTSGSATFGERWEKTFRGFNDWLSCCALNVAAEVQANYRRYRAEHGVVTFDDQIALALELTRNPAVISLIRSKDYIVILDEAQDTDPQQFEILLEITRRPDAQGRWIENPKQRPPRPGRFCMVGDFQQSIYGDRADLQQYRRIHEALMNSGAGQQLKFSVTFRLDQKQIDFVNKCFREILNNADGQVGFIRLERRPEKLPGQVLRVDITRGNLDPKARDWEKAKAGATQLASWIREVNLDKLRAGSWEQVAILCPRKKWFAPIADALRHEGIDSQVQSETDTKGDSPAHAWFTALLTIMTQPRCGFEIVGVLREIFGIADHELAIFCDGYGDRFQIEEVTGGSGLVPSSLDFLARIHAEIADKPLFAAVQRIVESTQLRARLQKLPPEDFDNLECELDVLLQSAASAEAEGQTLEQFTELLRANFTAEREAGATRPGAIQLITCQKAKGLEWDAVIVPFFSRQIYTRDDDFPRLFIDPQNRELIIAFSKGDLPARAKDALKKTRIQEMERLLYVGLTRARHTLALAVDGELFGQAPAESLTKWFRSDRGQSNEPDVTGLAIKASACSKTRAFQSDSALREKESKEIAELPEPVLGIATSRAADFFREIHPSNFISEAADIERTGAAWKEAEIEFRAQTLPSPATRYGVWWHEFAQKIPWRLPPEDWRAAFEKNVLTSPDPARSKREWNLLNQHVSARRDFFGGNIFAEMPFFWRMDEGTCLEGIIDLVLFHPAEKKWFVLDWKTNRIERAEIGKLRADYRPQIAAYWKAVTELTKQQVGAGIYSTVTGELLAYDESELADEWARLKNIATDQFVVEINRDERDQIRQSNGQLEFGGW